MISKKVIGKSKGRILAVKGESMYDVLRVATDQIAEGFLLCGYDVNILDVTIDEDVEIFCGEIVEPYSFIFVMQAILLNSTRQNRYITDIVDAQFYGWIFDDVIYHIGRLRVADRKNVTIFSIDGKAKENIGFLPEVSKKMEYLPHGGFVFDDEFAENKDIDILFPGTISEYPSFEEFKEGAMEVEILLTQKSIELIKIHPELSARAAIREVLNSLGEDLTDDLMFDLTYVIDYVSQYVRTYFRNSILNELVKSDYKIHLLGNNVNKTEFPSNVVVHGSLDIVENVKLMKRAKIVINPFPNIYEGGYHERIFTGMLCKAIIVTPYTPYLMKNIGSRIVYFDLNNLTVMMDRIAKILNEWDLKKSYVDDNYDYALTNHTFRKRGQQIIEYFEKTK